MSAAGDRWMAKVRALPCITCGVSAPSSVHHIRTERIKNDFLVIPLCPGCHQSDFSIHNSKEQFTNIFGSELHLLAKTIEALD